jgi:ribonuclease D
VASVAPSESSAATPPTPPTRRTPPASGAPAPAVEPAPLLSLREGLTSVVDRPADLARVVAAVADASGPVAIDAERASGYRYSARAYLVQVRREGAGTALVDPTVFADLSGLAAAIGDAEWIVHAASQDLPCLAEVGLRPASLFDTELAGRLLGYPRVGLATLVETVLGYRMRKEHSAVDWSTRPLPRPWLEYAALDVEVLGELRTALGEQLEEADKTEWARQEFAHLVRSVPPGPRPDPWRRTSGLHRVRGRRSLAAVRALWHARDEIAAERDVTPGRVIPDSAIIEAATALPRDRRALRAVKGFHGRGADRYAATWVAAVRQALELGEADLPQLAARYDGPPPPRTWADKNPVAAARLARARAELAGIAAEASLPVENLLSPDVTRRLVWDPPTVAREGLVEAVADRLRELGARPWQVELTATILAEVLAEPS